MEKKKPIQGILLMLLLVALPLGSWIYLKKGFNYQKEAIGELKQYGSLPKFVTKDLLGRSFSSDDIKGKLVFLNYVSQTKASNDRLKTVKALHEQFDDALGVVFLNIGLNPTAHTTVGNEFTNLDSNQVYFIPTYGEQPLFLGKEINYPLLENYAPGDSMSFNPITSEDLPDYPFFTIIDKDGIIRNFYPYDNRERIKRIVEHIALTMPRTIEPDPEMILEEK